MNAERRTQNEELRKAGNLFFVLRSAFCVLHSIGHMSLLIQGGRLIDPSQRLDSKVDLLIEDGVISDVGRKLRSNGDTIDAGGLVVVPGFIDLHTHLREPGQEHKETIATGTRAAVAGGYTAVCAMANTVPPNDERAVTEMIIAEAARNGACRVYPIGAVSKGLKGEALAELADLRAAGCVAVSDDGKPVYNAQLMRRALEYSSMLGIPVIAHEEDPNLSDGGVMHEGYYSTLLGMGGIPAASEETLVARDVILARLTGAHLHIAHVSTAGAIDAIRAARRAGVKVTCEVTPHHIALTDEAVQSFSTNLKMNPPLRSSEHRRGADRRDRRRHDRRDRHRSRAAPLRREERRVRSRAVRSHRSGDGVRSLLRPPGALEGDRPLAPRRSSLLRAGPHLRSSGRHAAPRQSGRRDDRRRQHALPGHEHVPLARLELAVHRRDAARAGRRHGRRRSAALRHARRLRASCAEEEVAQMTTKRIVVVDDSAAFCDLWSKFIRERYAGTSPMSRPTHIPTTLSRRSTRHRPAHRRRGDAGHGRKEVRRIRAARRACLRAGSSSPRPTQRTSCTSASASAKPSPSSTRRIPSSRKRF